MTESLRNFDLIPSLHQLFHVPAVQWHSKKQIFGRIMKYITDHPRNKAPNEGKGDEDCNSRNYHSQAGKRAYK